MKSPRSLDALKTRRVSKIMANCLDRVPDNDGLTPEQPKLPEAPKVGIFFVRGPDLWVDCTPVPDAAPYGEMMVHEKGHDVYWGELQAQGAVPKDEEYDEWPRGRCSYSAERDIFSLWADNCILQNEGMIARIVQGMNLPPEPFTEIGLDGHYRCPECMHRSTE